MIITKRALSRRTVLRGFGASLALPLLDSMIPALTAASQTAARATPRLGVIYVPHGAMMDSWTPKTVGRTFEFSPILKPLEPYRDHLNVLTGLSQIDRAGEGGNGQHARAAAGWLTGIVNPKQTSGSGLDLGISLDQIAAKTLRKQTQLPSLELALERPLVGACDVGWSCAYHNMSWFDAKTPMPREHNPRLVFEDLFGGGGTDAAARLASAKKGRSLLDSVTETVAQLNGRLGPQDRTRLDQYLGAVRDIELRLQRAEEQQDIEFLPIDQPAGVPAVFAEHAKLMFDLQIVAYQADITRVISLMMGMEMSARTFPEIGVPEPHHPLSHHSNDPELMTKCQKINTHHAELFAYYLEKLRSTADGDGSLLDQITILYGSALRDGNRHNYNEVPILVAGGGAGRLKTGAHIEYPPTTPLANLHVTLLHQLGVPVDNVGDSTGELAGISI